LVKCAFIFNGICYKGRVLNHPWLFEGISHTSEHSWR